MKNKKKMKELKSFLNESLSIDERYLEKMYLRKSTLPQDVIKTHLVEAFKYMWDEQGKTISSIEFNTLIEDVISKFDIRKELSWGNIIPEK